MENNTYCNLLKRIETNVDILQIKDHILNIPLWVLFRHSILTEIKRNDFDIGDPHLTQLKSLNYFNKIKKLILGITVYNPLLNFKSNDCVFINSQHTNVLYDNFYINRVHDLIKYELTARYFQCISIDDTINSQLTFPRSKSTYFNTVFYLKIRKYFIDDLLINHFFNLLNSVEGVVLNDSQISKLKLEMINNYSVIINTYYRYLSYFKKRKTKYLFLESAHYGDYNTAIILAAKENNVSVIECQHGLIYNEHVAYNFEYSFNTKKTFSKYYPDYFFTYGNYWSANCNIVNKVVSFGYPFLNFSVLNQSENLKFSQNKPYILIASSSISRNYYVDIVELLHLDYNIIFRPHPSEFSNYKNLYSAILNKCSIDISTNIYILIKNAKTVITEFSTILYESSYLMENVKLLLTEYTLKNMSKNELEYFDKIEIYSNAILETNRTKNISKNNLFNNEYLYSLNSLIK